MVRVAEERRDGYLEKKKEVLEESAQDHMKEQTPFFFFLPEWGCREYSFFFPER